MVELPYLIWLLWVGCSTSRLSGLGKRKIITDRPLWVVSCHSAPTKNQHTLNGGLRHFPLSLRERAGVTGYKCSSYMHAPVRRACRACLISMLARHALRKKCRLINEGFYNELLQQFFRMAHSVTSTL